MNNWFECILLHARAQPQTPAMVMEDRTVTYGMLGAAIERCARRIAALNIAPDGLVAVNDLGFLASNWQTSLPPLAPSAAPAASPFFGPSRARGSIIDLMDLTTANV